MIKPRSLKRQLKLITTQEQWDKVFSIVNECYEHFKNPQEIKKYPSKPKIGDKVYFLYKKTKCIGTIIKNNPKRAKIDVTVGWKEGIWFVPYSSLKPASKEDILKLTLEKMKNG